MKWPVAAQEIQAVLGSATGMPGFPWATQERHLHGMSLVEPVGGARGATQQMEAGGGHGLPLAEEGAFRTGSVQSLSQVRLSATPWPAACQASLSITNSQSLLELMSIESVMPSNYIILCCPLLLLPSIFPGIRVFSSKLALRIRWPKLELQLQHQSFY